MDKLTLTLTVLLTLYGPTTARLTLTDPRATFIEKSVLRRWRTYTSLFAIHRDYLQKKHSKLVQ